MIEWLTRPEVWGLAGLLFVAAEFLGPNFVLFFFGIGALLTAATTALFPPLGGSLLIQVLVWLGASVGTMLSLRRYLKGIFRGRVDRQPLEDEYRGKEATVVEAIASGHTGRVRFQGTTWDAVSYDETFAPGDAVQILKHENLTLVVGKTVADELAAYEAEQEE